MLVHGTVPFRQRASTEPVGQRARTSSHGQQSGSPRKQRLLPNTPKQQGMSSPQRSMMSLITPQMMVDQLYVDDGSGQRPVLEELIIPEVVPGTTPVYGTYPSHDSNPLGPEVQQNIPAGILKNRPDITPFYSAEINSRYSDNTAKLTSGSERNRWIDVDTMSTGTESELDFTGSETDDSDCSSYCNCQECIDNFRIAGIPPSREKHEICVKDSDTSSKTFGLLGKLFGFGSKRQSSRRKKKKTDEIEMDSNVQENKAPKSLSKEKVTRIVEPDMDLSDEEEYKGVAQPKTTSSILLDRLSRRQQQEQGTKRRPAAGMDNLAFQGDDTHLSSSPKAYEPLYLRNCSAVELQDFVSMLQPSPKLDDILEHDPAELGEERISPIVSKIELNTNGDRSTDQYSTLPVEVPIEKSLKRLSNKDISRVIQGKPGNNTRDETKPYENNNVTTGKLNHTIPEVTVTEPGSHLLPQRPSLQRDSSGDTGSEVSTSPQHTSEGATEDEGYVTVTGVSTTNC